MTDSQSIALRAFASSVLISFSVDEIKNMTWHTEFYTEE